MGLFRSLYDFFMPRYCKVCGERLTVGEEHVCMGCYARMPFIEWDGQGELSPAERILAAEPGFVRAASVMQYEKESNYRKILYHLKYHGHPDVGVWLSEIGAQRLNDKGFFEGIDLIVPVPLSKRKRRHRGYNQCSYVAFGIRKVTGLPVFEDILTRERGKSRQAGLGRFQRWKNASGLYNVARPECLNGKHMLLVDDVMTTGATLCSVMSAIHESVPDAKVSVFTLAIAGQ